MLEAFVYCGFITIGYLFATDEQPDPQFHESDPIVHYTYYTDQERNLEIVEKENGDLWLLPKSK